MLGPSSCSENRQNTGSTSYVENDLVLKVLGIVLNSSLVGSRANAIFEHFLVNVELGVAAKVIVVVFARQVREGGASNPAQYRDDKVPCQTTWGRARRSVSGRR